MPNVQAARLSAFDDPAHLSLDDRFLDDPQTGSGAGPHTISVETVFRGVGIGAKILAFPHEVRQSERSRWLLIGGAALVAVALVVFAVVAVSVDARKATSGAVDVAFVVSLLGGGGLLVAGLARRRHAREGADFLVGAAPGVDAPIDPRLVSVPAHPLVIAASDEWIVNATPQMRGDVSAGGQIRSLAELAREGTASFRLPPGARARLVCGATTFLLAAIRQPCRLPRPFVRWKRPEMIYTACAALALGLFVIVVFSVPPDPRALSLDLLNNENHLITFRITPPEERKEDRKDAPPSPATPAAPSGKSGARAAGQGGAMGAIRKKASLQHDRATAIEGPKDNPDPRLAAENRAREAGILGVFKKMSDPVAAIFAHESALGSEAEDAIGNLVGRQTGEAAGLGGLGISGSGSKGGGTGEGLLGLGGDLPTIGHGPGAGGTEREYGRLAGTLGPRQRTKIHGILSTDATVHGALDREIIRRIVRRHLNEVRFCYEQELTRQPALAGRIVVQFMIAGSGQVISSVLQTSTMANARVETCTVQAVRRWSFPEPQGGGLVTVSYPFALTPAGG